VRRGAFPPKEAFTLLDSATDSLRFQPAQGAGSPTEVETAMTDPIRELKIRAAILQRGIVDRQPTALARLRALPEFRPSSAHIDVAGNPIRRRHCLAILARELGFNGWPHAKDVISGARNVSDFGTALYPKRCGGHLNLWYRSYDDAATGWRASGGYLLAYRRHYMVVDALFIEMLGLDPNAPDWQRLGRNWVRPLDVSARTRLYGELIANMPREVYS
jgi:hypothetical protein